MNPIEFQPTITEMRALFMMIMKAHARGLEDYLRERDIALSAVQMGILRITSVNPKTISEISKVMLLDPSTLVPLVDDLERRGLLERTKDPSDRRRMPLVLTETGTDMILRIKDIHTTDALAQSLQTLSVDDLQALLRILRDVVNRLPEGEEMLCELHSHLYPAGDMRVTKV